MKLHCYASGDGSLSFTYLQNKWNLKTGELEKLAISKEITRHDIEKFIKLKENDRLKDYLIVQIGKETIERRTVERLVEQPKRKPGRPRKDGIVSPTIQTETIEVKRQPQFRLCAPVRRIGDNQLQLNDKVYSYKVDENNIFWTRDKKYTDFNLTITTNLDDEEFEVRHLSTKAAIRWFLNNENLIVEQYPEQVALQHPLVSQHKDNK